MVHNVSMIHKIQEKVTQKSTLTFCDTCVSFSCGSYNKTVKPS